MTKIVYNACYGGFSLSDAALRYYARLTGTTFDDVNYRGRRIERKDPHLVAVVEKMGAKANGAFAELRIAEIPEGTKYRIDEYDGNERVKTIDDYDWEIA